jgi:hypothetical protein
LFDWFCFIRITGLRVAEYAQLPQTSVDVNKYPSGKTVTEAFIANDWKFYDKKGKVVDVSCPTSMPVKVKATFRIQKNRQNGQWVTIVSDDKHPDICPVRAMQRIVEQAKGLGKFESEPLAVFLNHHGLKSISQLIKLPRFCKPMQDRSIRTCLRTKSAIFHHTQEEYGP